MAAKGNSDSFANLATITVTESAANTLTFKKLETGISLNEKVAWIISRVEYHVLNYYDTLFNSSKDQLCVGLSVYNGFASALSAAGLTEPTILDRFHIERTDIGTAASGMLTNKMYIKDFSDLPGGGLIVPPTPIYGFTQCSGAAEASNVVIRLYYTLLSLSPDQYWQLVESRRVISA